MGLFNWKKKNKNCQNENVKENDNEGQFAGFVLLNSVEFDAQLFAKTLKEDWGIAINPSNIESDNYTIAAEVDGMMVAIGLMPAPVPNDEAVENAKTNIMWRNAVDVAKEHKAHVLIAVLKREQDTMDAAKLFVKVCASCLKQPNATAINTLGSVLEPNFYMDCANTYLGNDDFPVLNLVFFGLYSSEQGVSGYTFGMNMFGKKDIEVVNSKKSAEDIYEFMIDIASYVIENDVTLQNGETIGFSEEQKLPTTQSKGIAIGGNTLKIGF